MSGASIGEDENLPERNCCEGWFVPSLFGEVHYAFIVLYCVVEERNYFFICGFVCEV